MSIETSPFSIVQPDQYAPITEQGEIDGLHYHIEGESGYDSRAYIDYNQLVDSIKLSLRQIIQPDTEPDRFNKAFDNTIISKLREYTHALPADGIVLTTDQFDWFPPWLELFEHYQQSFDRMNAKMGESMVPLDRPTVEIRANGTTVWSGRLDPRTADSPLY